MSVSNTKFLRNRSTLSTKQVLFWILLDPRTNDLPFVGSPIIIPSILLLYLYVILKFGPEFMKARKPYDLKTFVRCYDAFQIVANAYIVQQFISAGWFTEITVFCEIPDYSFNPGPLKVSFHFLINKMRMFMHIYISIDDWVIKLQRQRN